MIIILVKLKELYIILLYQNKHVYVMYTIQNRLKKKLKEIIKMADNKRLTDKQEEMLNVLITWQLGMKNTTW